MNWDFHSKICWRESTPLGEPVPPSSGMDFNLLESTPEIERQERWEKMKSEWNHELDAEYEAMTEASIDRIREKRTRL